MRPGTAGPSPTSRLEGWVTTLAVLLIMVPTLRHPELNVSVSDALFCFSGVLLLVSRQITSAMFTAALPIWMVGFALFWGGLIASSLVNDRPMRAMITGSQYLFAYMFVPFVLMRFDPTQLIRFVRALVIGMFLVNLYGIIWYGLSDDPADNHITLTGRLMSLMEDPNAYATLMALVMPFVLYCWLTQALPIWAIVAAVVGLLISVVLTASFGGLSSMVLGATVFLLLTANPRILLGAAVVIGTFIAVGAALGPEYWPDIFEQRVLGAFQSGDLNQAGTFSGRMELIDMALEMVDQSIWLGIGADQFRHAVWMDAPVHNTFLLIWVEGGLPAMIGLLVMMLAALMNGVLAYRSPESRAAGALAIAVTLVFALIATFSAHMYARFWVVPLFVAAALAIGAIAQRRLPPLPVPHPTHPARGSPAEGSVAPRRARPAPVGPTAGPLRDWVE